MDDDLGKIANTSNDFPERIVAGSVDLDAYLYHISRYIFAAQLVDGRLVLDAGCGTGYGSYYLSRNSASRVVGIDVNASAIRYAHNDYECSRLALVVADATHLPLKKHSFGAVTSFETIEHVSNPSDLLLESYRVLDRKGLFIASTPNRKRFLLMGQNRINPFHRTEFTFKELGKAIVQGGFSVVHVGTQVRVQPAKRKLPVSSQACRISRSIPKNVKRIVQLLKEVFFNGVSLSSALRYYRGEPREISGEFSYRNLPAGYRVLNIDSNENPDSHEIFVVTAKKN